MALEDKVNQLIKTAMLAKDEASLRALRALKSAILLEKTSGSEKEFDDDAGVRIIQKLVKQRKDSIEIYEKQGRSDLAATEKEEVEVLQQFLPAQLSEAELRITLQQLIATLGASSPADTGKVMGAASKALAGKADNKMIASLVREMLSK